VTDIDIDKLETLRAAATQGPFVHVTPPPGYSFGFIGYYVEYEGERLRSEFPACDADDAYTVELLNAAPALFAEVRRLRRIEAAARQIERDGMYVTLPILAKHWDELRAALAAKEGDNGKA
jgi:hypothetical protein